MKDNILNLSIAGFTIEIIFHLSQSASGFERQFIDTIRDYYREFIINKKKDLKIDYSIEVKYEYNFKVIIDNHKKITHIRFFEQINNKRLKTYYHLSGTHFQLIIRKITQELLVKHRGFFLHASASKVKNRAVLFVGASGMGKSTTMTRLSPFFQPLADDSIIIKKEEGEYYCYSSSAKEKNAWFLKEFKRHNLAAIYFINKSTKTQATKITDKQLVIQLITRQFFTEEKDLSIQMKNLLYFVQHFSNFYHLDISLNQIDELKFLVEKNNEVQN